MAVAPDEQDWLANNWRILRRMLARLFDHLIEPISNDIVRNGKVSDGDWNVLMNQALKTLAEKAPTSPMHGFAMSLLGDGQTQVLQWIGTCVEHWGGKPQKCVCRVAGRFEMY